jgi:hypothetical protein
MSAVILAQVAVGAEVHAEPARETLVAMLDGNADRVTREGLAQARVRRAANPTMSAHEVQLLGDAEELIRALLH